MRCAQKALPLVLLLGIAGGCSIRGQDLSKDSFQGTIKYASVRVDRSTTGDTAAVSQR